MNTRPAYKNPIPPRKDTSQAPLGVAVEHAIRAAKDQGRLALIAYLTAGFPSRKAFPDLLRQTADVADVVEVGVPFSDPIADGPTIQRSSAAAVADSANQQWVLETLASMHGQCAAPIALMGYLNPILQRGIARFAHDVSQAGVGLCIIPDAPLEVADSIRGELAIASIGIVGMVTSSTPKDRAERIAKTTDGFLYAVASTGVTGGTHGISDEAISRTAALRHICDKPVCVGFGVRDSSHVQRLSSCADGVIVGSALVEAIDAGEQPAALLSRIMNG